MAFAHRLTGTHFLNIIEAPIREGGLLDLRGADLRDVEFNAPEIRRALSTLLTLAGNDVVQPFFVDLTGANISGRNFSNLDLSHVIMTGVTAEKTIFTGAHLEDTRLDDADLTGADFRNTRLNFTKLFGSIIHGANFSFADLSTAHGLRLRKPGKQTVERLSVAGSIHGATLPAGAEYLRDEIETAILAHKNAPSGLHIGSILRNNSSSW